MVIWRYFLSIYMSEWNFDLCPQIKKCFPRIGVWDEVLANFRYIGGICSRRCLIYKDTLQLEVCKPTVQFSNNHTVCKPTAVRLLKKIWNISPVRSVSTLHDRNKKPKHPAKSKVRYKNTKHFAIFFSCSSAQPGCVLSGVSLQKFTANGCRM